MLYVGQTDGLPEISLAGIGIPKDLNLELSTTIQMQDLCFVPALEMSQLAGLVTKLDVRRKSLEHALLRKEESFDALLKTSAKLKQDLKNKEMMRIYQLEILALRNIELERLLEQKRSLNSAPSLMRISH